MIAVRAASMISMLSLLAEIFLLVRADAKIPAVCAKDEQCHNAQESGTGTGVLWISASMDANFSQFFPCLNSINRSEALLPPTRKSSQHPPFTSLPCVPEPSACFRAVYDGHGDLLDRPAEEQVDRLRSVVESLIIPKKGVPSGERPALVQSLLRSKTYDEENTRQGFENYGQMHADYFESTGYVYTAILYDEPSEDLSGGETVVVDARGSTSLLAHINGTNEDTGTDGQKFHQNHRSLDSNIEPQAAKARRQVPLKSGLMVQPKKGRLLLFTGGGENIHAPLMVIRGQRPTLHVWFKCG